MSARVERLLGPALVLVGAALIATGDGAWGALVAGFGIVGVALGAAGRSGGRR